MAPFSPQPRGRERAEWDVKLARHAAKRELFGFPRSLSTPTLTNARGDIVPDYAGLAHVDGGSTAPPPSRQVMRWPPRILSTPTPPSEFRAPYTDGLVPRMTYAASPSAAGGGRTPEQHAASRGGLQSSRSASTLTRWRDKQLTPLSTSSRHRSPTTSSHAEPLPPGGDAIGQLVHQFAGSSRPRTLNVGAAGRAADGGSTSSTSSAALRFSPLSPAAGIGGGSAGAGGAVQRYDNEFGSWLRSTLSSADTMELC